MKHKNNKHKHFHQYVEQILRHRSSVLGVLMLMFVAAAGFDTRIQSLMREAYHEGWGWVGTYLHHEHPMHGHHIHTLARLTTTSGPGPSA